MTKTTTHSLLFLLLVLGLTSSRATVSPSATIALTRIPRGGGWFGRFNRKNNRGNGGGDDNGGNNKRYPFLTQAEIEEKLDIPVFAITDLQGNSVIARNKNDGEDIQYLFLSEKMAEQALQQLVASNTLPGMELKLAPLHLGKMWFRYLHNDTATFQLTSSPAQPTKEQLAMLPQKKISFRLVPDARNLMSARLMTTIKPDELRKAMEHQSQEQVQAIVQKAASNSRNFTANYNDVPLFLIPTMRAQKNDNPGAPLMMPVFLGARDLIQAYLQENSPNSHTLVSVTSLHKLVQMMQEDSDFDFRSIVLFPLQDEADNKDDDDDNDGGGGDFGITAQEEEEPQIEMEMYADFGGSSWETGQDYQQLMSL